jgi:hypothetical protein
MRIRRVRQALNRLKQLIIYANLFHLNLRRAEEYMIIVIPVQAGIQNLLRQFAEILPVSFIVTFYLFETAGAGAMGISFQKTASQQIPLHFERPLSLDH